MRNKGFTIIEVMIVLAIVGLIMVIVFMAVPALKRNTRNNQRKHDMARIIAALQEYQNTYGGVPETWRYNEVNLGGWDHSSQGDFMQFLNPFMDGDVPVDPINDDTGDRTPGKYTYSYYCYPPRGVSLGYRTEPSGNYVYILYRNSNGTQYKCL